MSWFKPKPNEAPTTGMSETSPPPRASDADDDEIPIDMGTGASQVSAISAASASSSAGAAVTSGGAAKSSAAGSIQPRAASTSAPRSGSSSSSGVGPSEGRTTLTDDTTVVGSITTASDLWIAGRVEGAIESGAAVHVTPEGAVVGDVTSLRIKIDKGGLVEGGIQTGEAAIDGRVRGSVSSSGRLVISPSGEVFGDVSAHSLHVDDGATLQGRCTMTRR